MNHYSVGVHEKTIDVHAIIKFCFMVSLLLAAMEEWIGKVLAS